MSDDPAHPAGLFARPSSHDFTEVLSLAEAYPTVAIRILFAELQHAEAAVPVGADDRAEIIARLVQARLGPPAGQ